MTNVPRLGRTSRFWIMPCAAVTLCLRFLLAGSSGVGMCGRRQPALTTVLAMEPRAMSAPGSPPAPEIDEHLINVATGRVGLATALLIAA